MNRAMYLLFLVLLPCCLYSQIIPKTTDSIPRPVVFLQFNLSEAAIIEASKVGGHLDDVQLIHRGWHIIETMKQTQFQSLEEHLLEKHKITFQQPYYYLAASNRNPRNVLFILSPYEFSFLSKRTVVGGGEPNYMFNEPAAEAFITIPLRIENIDLEPILRLNYRFWWPRLRLMF